MSTSIGAYNVIFDGDSDPVVKAAKEAEGALKTYERAIEKENAAFVQMLEEAKHLEREYAVSIESVTKTSLRMGSGAFQQLALGLQDATAVMGTTGLSGALRAASNNVIQFGSLLHPLAGTIAAVAFTGLQPLADHFAKTGEAAQKATDQIASYVSEVEKNKKAAAQLKRIKDIENIDTAAGARSRVKDIAEEKARIAEEMRLNDRALKEQQDKIDAVMADGKDIFMVFNEEIIEWDKMTPAEKRQNMTKDMLDTIADAEREIGKLRDENIKLSEQQRDIDKQDAAAKKQLVALEGKEMVKAADAAWAEQEKQLAWEHKQAEATRKAEQAEAKKADRNRDKLRVQAQGNTPEGKAANIIDQTREMIDQIREAGFGDAERAKLIDSAVEGAKLQLGAIRGAGLNQHHFGGAAEFGSASAFANAANASVQEPQTDELRKLVDLGKKQLDALKAGNKPAVANF